MTYIYVSGDEPGQPVAVGSNWHHTGTVVKDSTLFGLLEIKIDTITITSNITNDIKSSDRNYFFQTYIYLYT